MKKSTRSLIYALIALTCLAGRSLAQDDGSDESYYNLLYEGKSLQADVLAQQLQTLWAQETQDRQAISDDNWAIGQMKTQIDSDNSAWATARNDLASAQSALSNDQNTVSSIESQMSADQSTMSSDSDEISTLEQSLSDDDDQISWLQSEIDQDYYLTQDEIDVYQQEIYNLLDDEANLNYWLGWAEASYNQASSDYDSLSGQLTSAQAQVASDQNAVNSAQNAVDYAAGSYAVDAQQLQQFEDDLTAEQQDLDTVVSEATSKEDDYMTEYNWLQANSSYAAWVANGRPE